MVEQVEATSFDLRYEGCRIGNKAAEQALLASILENGIRDPLRGVDAGDDIEQRRLAGAVGADDGDEIPGVDVQVDIVERLYLVNGAGAELLGNLL